jgi:TatD DNase family protein
LTPVPSLIDIGANLTNKAFRADLEPVLARAKAAGVTRMVITGTSLHESQRAAEMAAGRPDVLCSTAGVHPHNAKICDEGVLERIKELAARPEVRAIGECGLDFNRDFSPRPDQKHWFEEQVKLASDVPARAGSCGRPARDPGSVSRRARQGLRALFHRGSGSAGRLPGAGLSHRHHRLDLR